MKIRLAKIINIMNQPSIIAICGYRRSGKDTVADILSEKYLFKKIKIAYKLKEIVKVLFDFNDFQLEIEKKDIIDPRWNTSPRQIMQFFGTDIMQFKIQEIMPHIGRSFFIESLINYINTQTTINKWVISDLRFVHEWKCLQKYNTFIIRVENDNIPKIDTHISETEWLDITPDLIIKNNLGINDLSNYIHTLDIDNLIKSKKKTQLMQCE